MSLMHCRPPALFLLSRIRYFYLPLTHRTPSRNVYQPRIQTCLLWMVTVRCIPERTMMDLRGKHVHRSTTSTVAPPPRRQSASASLHPHPTASGSESPAQVRPLPYPRSQPSFRSPC